MATVHLMVSAEVKARDSDLASVLALASRMRVWVRQTEEAKPKAVIAVDRLGFPVGTITETDQGYVVVDMADRTSLSESARQTFATSRVVRVRIVS